MDTNNAQYRELQPKKIKLWLPLAQEDRGQHYSALRLWSEPFYAEMDTYYLARKIQNEMRAVSCDALVGKRCERSKWMCTRISQRNGRDPVLFDQGSSWSVWRKVTTGVLDIFQLPVINSARWWRFGSHERRSPSFRSRVWTVYSSIGSLQDLTILFHEMCELTTGLWGPTRTHQTR